MKKEINCYFITAIFLIAFLIVISVVSIYLNGLNNSGFVIGILSSSIGAAITYLFNMSKEKNLILEKEIKRLKLVKAEVSVNRDLLLEWQQKTKDWSSITFQDSITKLISIDRIKNLDMTMFNEEETKDIYLYLKNIIKIQFGKSMEPKEFKDVVFLSQKILDIITKKAQ